MLPTNFPSWEAVYQQIQCSLRADCFEAMAQDLHSVLFVAQGRQAQTSAVVLNGRTLQSSCERGPRAGYGGDKRKRASKVHMVVNTLGHWLAVHVTPVNEQARAQVPMLAQAGQLVSGQSVKLAFADQGYIGEEPAQATQDEGIELQGIKRPEATKGFILLPRRQIVERSFGWLKRLRRLARDDERLPETLVGLHFVVFAMLMRVHAAPILQSA